MAFTHKANAVALTSHCRLDLSLLTGLEKKSKEKKTQLWL